MLRIILLFIHVPAENK